MSLFTEQELRQLELSDQAENGKPGRPIGNSRGLEQRKRRQQTRGQHLWDDDRVIEALARLRGATVAELAVDLDIDSCRLTSGLRRMADHGLVTHDNNPCRQRVRWRLAGLTVTVQESISRMTAHERKRAIKEGWITEVQA